MRESGTDSLEQQGVDYAVAHFASLSIRDDLEFLDGEHISEDALLVFDPLRWEYQIIGGFEYAVLSLIDECNSIDEVEVEFEREYAAALSTDDVVQVISTAVRYKWFDLWSYPDKTFHRSGNASAELLSSIELAGTHADEDTQDWWNKAQLLASENRFESLAKHLRARLDDSGAEYVYSKLLKTLIRRPRWELTFAKSRLELFDPTSLFRMLKFLCGWIHSWPFILVLGFLSYTALQIPSEAYSFVFDPMSPKAREFFQLDNLVFAPLITWSSIFLHEVVGHGLALHRYGGRVPAIGLLVFFGVMPVGYANTTDSYRLESKWQRIHVSLAGIAVNLVLAMSSLCASQLVTAGRSSERILLLATFINFGMVLPNLLPWIKLDGYYVLVDLISVPSLQERAHAMAAGIGRWFLYGERDGVTNDHGLVGRYRLVGWTFFVGQITFVAVILSVWLLLALPRVLGTLGLLALLIVSPLIIKLTHRLLQSVQTGSKSGDFRQLFKTWLRPTRLSVAATAVTIIFFWPFEWSLPASASALPADETLLTAATSGVVVELPRRPGANYSAGEPVARIEQPRLGSRLTKAKANLDAATAALEQLLNNSTELERKQAALERVRAKRESAFARMTFERTSSSSDLLDGREVTSSMARAIEARGDMVSAKNRERQLRAGARPEEIAKAQAEVAWAQAELRQIEQERSKLSLAAPFSGTVAEVIVQNGDYVRAGAPLARLVRTDEVCLDVRVPVVAPIHLIDNTRLVRFRSPALGYESVMLSVKSSMRDESGDLHLKTNCLQGERLPISRGSTFASVPLRPASIATHIGQLTFYRVQQFLLNIVDKI